MTIGGMVERRRQRRASARASDSRGRGRAKEAGGSGRLAAGPRTVGGRAHRRRAAEDGHQGWGRPGTGPKEGTGRLRRGTTGAGDRQAGDEVVRGRPAGAEGRHQGQGRQGTGAGKRDSAAAQGKAPGLGTARDSAERRKSYQPSLGVDGLTRKLFQNRVFPFSLTHDPSSTRAAANPK